MTIQRQLVIQEPRPAASVARDRGPEVVVPLTANVFLLTYSYTFELVPESPDPQFGVKPSSRARQPLNGPLVSSFGALSIPRCTRGTSFITFTSFSPLSLDLRQLLAPPSTAASRDDRQYSTVPEPPWRFRSFN